MKKKSVAELGHNDILSVYDSYFAKKKKKKKKKIQSHEISNKFSQNNLQISFIFM